MVTKSRRSRLSSYAPLNNDKNHLKIPVKICKLYFLATPWQLKLGGSKIIFPDVLIIFVF